MHISKYTYVEAASKHRLSICWSVYQFLLKRNFSDKHKHTEQAKIKGDQKGGLSNIVKKQNFRSPISLHQWIFLIIHSALETTPALFLICRSFLRHSYLKLLHKIVIFVEYMRAGNETLQGVLSTCFLVEKELCVAQIMKKNYNFFTMSPYHVSSGLAIFIGFPVWPV